MKTIINNTDEKGRLITIDIVKANIYAILSLIPIIIIFGLPFFIIWKDKYSLTNISTYIHSIGASGIATISIKLIIVTLLGVVIHELIHGIIWSFYTKKGWKSINFGFIWQMLTPYCHCSEPLTVKHYILGSVMPGIILGQIPALVAIQNGNIFLLLFGIFFSIAAVGDYMIVFLLRNEASDSLILDHETEVGCWLLEDNSKKKDG